MHKLGLVSISFRSLTPEQIIAATKEAGLSCIEWGSDVHAPCNDIPKLQAIAAATKDAGLECCSYGTYFYLGKHDPEEIRDYIAAAKILGTNILRLWCGTKDSCDYTPEERENLYADCRKVAKIAEEEGVTLCMECHGRSMTDCKEEMLALMAAVNSPAFQMYWQPNLKTVEDNLDYAQAIAPYTYHIHAFHWVDRKAYSLAEGADRWQKYLAAFDEDHCILLEFMPDHRVESLNAEAKALSEITGVPLK